MAKRTITDTIEELKTLDGKRAELLNELTEFRAQLDGYLNPPTRPKTPSGREIKPRGPKHCSNCGEPGHTAKTCPNPKKA